MYILNWIFIREVNVNDILCLIKLKKDISYIILIKLTQIL